jgi:prepilin peptidase CpaA
MIIDIPLAIILMTLMGASVVQDWRFRKIPNRFTFPAMAIAIIYHTFFAGLNGLYFSLGGFGLGIGFFIIPYLLGGMGAGDAKLMGAAGAILGPKGIFVATIVTVAAGGVYAAILFLMNLDYSRFVLRRLWTTFKTFIFTMQFIPIPPGKEEKQPVLRFAIPIAIGTMSYLILEATGYDLIPTLFGHFFST